MRKSVQYNMLGAFGGVIGLIIIMGWVNLRVYGDWFGQTGIYYPWVPALPYLAVFAFMLSCLCFVFGYLESVREVELRRAV